MRVHSRVVLSSDAFICSAQCHWDAGPLRGGVGYLSWPVWAVPSFGMSLSALPRLRFSSGRCLIWAYKTLLVHLKPADREWERFMHSWMAGASCFISVILLGNSVRCKLSVSRWEVKGLLFPCLGYQHAQKWGNCYSNFVMEVKTHKKPQNPLIQRSESST